MSSSQLEVTREVVGVVHDFLGGPSPEGDEWRFDFGEHLCSNWGAAYGGALAAGMLVVGRSAAPDRVPRSMHIQIVRSVPSGPAWASATVRHPGRTVATVEVDLFDARRKLAAIALLTMVAPDAVASDYDRSGAAPPFHLIESPVPDSRLMDGAMTAGIVAALKMKDPGAGLGLSADNARPSVDGSMAAALECTVPWENVELTGPEAACLVADACVALPTANNSYIASEDIGPNADLTLRFTAAPASRVIVGAAALLSVQRGTATIGLEVQSGEHQLAHGLATSLLLGSS